MSATYQGLQFATPLHAQWAAFFDLAGWTWHTNPVSVDDWQPDFLVTFPCGHSECGESHTILVSVVPHNAVSGLEGHPALRHQWGVKDSHGRHVADAGAAFGYSPSVSKWVMSHGAGGGEETVPNWVHRGEPTDLWRRAGELVQRR